MSGVYMSVDIDGRTGKYQLSIHDKDGGYRIGGPEFNGSSEQVFSKHLSKSDIREIIKILTDSRCPECGSRAHVAARCDMRG